MESTAKSRAPNFTQQECLLLASIMGEMVDGLSMNRHAYDKHRFTDRITSVTKRQQWAEVANKFNANNVSTHVRSPLHVAQKWENLVAKERNIYTDHERHKRMTGSAPYTSKYSLLTEAVMDVIGRNSIGVKGIGAELDSLIPVAVEKNDNVTVVKDVNKLYNIENAPICKRCHCDAEIVELEKKKLRLEIKILEKKLQEE